MTAPLQPQSHPEPDILSAFAEGALPEHEKPACLAHLAECSRCRDIVFLSRPPAQTPTPARRPAVTKTERGWRQWFAPMPALGSALTLATLAIAFLVYRQTLPVQNHPVEVASARPPATDAPLEEANPTVVAPPSTQSPASASRLPAAKRTHAGPQDRPEPKISTPVPLDNPSLGQEPVAPPPAPENAFRAQNAPPPPASAQLLPPPPQSPSQMGSANPAPFQAKSQSALGGSVALKRKGNFATPPDLTVAIEHQAAGGNGLSQVKGSVRDLTGAAVRGATVAIQQVGDTKTGTAVTNANGEFSVEALPPGQYDLRITAPGFQSSSAKVTLQAEDQALVASTLRVGSSTQTVEVTAASPNLQVSGETVTRSPSPSKPLPSKLLAVLTASNGKLALAMDGNGTIFFSKNTGKHWKAIHAQWPGKVARIAVTSDAIPFHLTTEAGAVWESPDGTHWRPSSQTPPAVH